MLPRRAVSAKILRLYKFIFLTLRVSLIRFFKPSTLGKSQSRLKPGRFMKVKVNVGCSNRRDPVDLEKQKIEYALARQVDYISEISLIPEKKAELLDFISRLDHQKTKFCTVPLYDSVLTSTDIFEVLKSQYKKGIRAFTLHLTPQKLIQAAIREKFVINSRAGNFLNDLAKQNRENPHFEVFP
ncbi:MAG: hypothetical protein EOP09_16525, partial [Proteobacteria bacterium]